MNNQNIVNDIFFTLSYWHACETFGEVAVNKILSRSVWSKKYPEVIHGIHSGEIKDRNRTVLPGDVVYEIAGHPECLYDFYTSEDGESIYASYRNKPLIRPSDTSKAKYIPGQDALMLFGSYALFRAADIGEGRKGE